MNKNRVGLISLKWKYNLTFDDSTSEGNGNRNDDKCLLLLIDTVYFLDVFDKIKTDCESFM